MYPSFPALAVLADSAWEEIGGSVFAGDELQLEDPTAFNLDLSGWEARLKPLSAHMDAGVMFPPFFGAPDLRLGAHAGLCTSTCTSAGAPSESAQVVPMCPATSAGSFDHGLDDHGLDGADGFVDATVLDEVAECSNFDEVDGMPLSFPGMELQPLGQQSLVSASPTISEAGVVPDLGLGGSPQAYAQGSFGATSSGRADLQPVGSIASNDAALPGPVAPPSLLTQLPVSGPQPSTGLFVPIDQTGMGGADVIKSEPLSEGAVGTYGEATQRCSSSPSPSPACEPQAVPEQPQKRASAARPQPSAQVQSAAQQAGVHIRTRAECLERYREKKARRLYTKKIRYQLRKINADKRPRIKGRFVKKEELADYLATQQAAAAFAADDGDAMDSDYE
ncbi:hypothetical protein GPECTOR_67g331 [Gonium pectorale]|uniref:CCT domain-containing protein n=1 Tax=Gonium pectorale TaxID=33097 RepID=A0A150G596_GONPE|nr:hypothetical protein GPECTOR_67g331 [Gonium pectorale]|eukprot:KXZ44490.1 hypothetical protein GPECTOR_67g331 [Gonium pectorale]